MNILYFTEEEMSRTKAQISLTKEISRIMESLKKLIEETEETLRRQEDLLRWVIFGQKFYQACQVKEQVSSWKRNWKWGGLFLYSQPNKDKILEFLKDSQRPIDEAVEFFDYLQIPKNNVENLSEYIRITEYKIVDLLEYLKFAKNKENMKLLELGFWKFQIKKTTILIMEWLFGIAIGTSRQGYPHYNINIGEFIFLSCDEFIFWCSSLTLELNKDRFAIFLSKYLWDDLMIIQTLKPLEVSYQNARFAFVAYAATGIGKSFKYYQYYPIPKKLTFTNFISPITKERFYLSPLAQAEKFKVKFFCQDWDTYHLITSQCVKKAHQYKQTFFQKRVHKFKKYYLYLASILLPKILNKCSQDVVNSTFNLIARVKVKDKLRLSYLAPT